MDRKEMRDGTRMMVSESRARKHRVRSYKSLIINLVALIGLFALVFVLQQLGTRHVEETGKAKPAAPATEVTAEAVTLEKQTPVVVPAEPAQQKPAAKIKNQEVAIVEMQTTEEGAAQPKAEAKIILKTKNKKAAARTYKTTGNNSYRGSSYQEDRQRSAALVDMLDGGHPVQYSNNASRTYTTSNTQRTTYASTGNSHDGRADRRSSAELVDMLDGRAPQSTTQGSKRFNWADEVPMASTQTYNGVEETTLTSQTGTREYATAAPEERPTYVAPSRRPAWDVNAGGGR